MSVKRVESKDERLDKNAEFEWQVIGYKSGIMIDNYWQDDSTIIQIIDRLQYRYEGKIDVSVWNYEGEVKIMATPEDLQMFDHYYAITMM